MSRALPRSLTALVALSTLAGCRSDTIRTTDGGTKTTVPLVSSTTGPGTGRSPTSKPTGTSRAGGSTISGPAGSSSSDAVVLGGGSLGPTSIGAAADPAVAAMKQALGNPTRDLSNPGSACPGPDRLVTWGRLSLYFSGGKLAGWAYDIKPAGPPQLSTPSGVTVGTTVATLRRVYGDKLQVRPADELFPAGFRVPVGASDLTGTLTGTGGEDTTTSLAYGMSCGE